MATLVVVIGYLIWGGQSRRRIVANLGAADRHAVFETTIAGFKKLCVDRTGAGFEEYCGGQRDFLALFPECDSGCVRLLAKAEQVPTR
jgi:hypothetical protein